MQKLYPWLAGLLLLARPAIAQAQDGPLHPAQTIALGPHATVGGTVVLPNHNTVLLLTDAESPTIIAQCLGPDGQTRWKTTLTRFGHAAFSAYLLFDTREIAVGRKATDDKQLRKDISAARLYPVNVATDDNELVLTEYIFQDSPKNSPVKVKGGQLFVQRLDEQGQLTKHLFEPAPAPEDRKTEVAPLGRYADASGYAEVMREYNKRDETKSFFILHYDLKTGTLRREPLPLPATPGRISGSKFREWYQEWEYLGHRPGQTYFCRRVLADGPKEQPGAHPLTYQVFIADDHGQPASPSGFSTTLDLNANTRPGYSGNLPGLGAANHLPNYYEKKVFNSYVTYDEWQTSAGGYGSFYLDPATGEVLIFGEYGAGGVAQLLDLELLGIYLRRYAPDGRVLAQSQMSYTEAMRAFKSRASFQAYRDRSTYFHADPLNGEYQFTSSVLPTPGNNETYSFYFDHALSLLRYDHPVAKPKTEPALTCITFAQPTILNTGFSTTSNSRVYEHAAKTDLPVYSALERLRRAAPASAEYYQFHLSATGPGTGLVVEQPLGVGGALKVYTF